MEVSKGDLVDSLFGDMLQDSGNSGKLEVKQVGVRNLFPFKNHPFKVKDDDNFRSLKESISKYGISEPIIVRRREGQTGYEIISGHRRSEAARQLGMDKVPVLVTDLNDDMATILMVDGNKKRDKLDPSEKAYAFKMRMEAEGHIRKSDGSGMTTAVKIGKDFGVSERSVFNFIRLTELLPELLQAVDDKKLRLGTAVEISYLDKDEQKAVYNYYKGSEKFPDKVTIKELKEKGSVTAGEIEKIMAGGKNDRKNYLDRFSEYFPEEYTDEDRLNVIKELLEGWKKNKNSELML